MSHDTRRPTLYAKKAKHEYANSDSNLDPTQNWRKKRGKPCDRYRREGQSRLGVPEIGTSQVLGPLAACAVLRNMIAIEHCRFM